MSTKISKACELCRLRKTRCNGSSPCQRRECREAPESCVYRSKARIRKSLKRQAGGSLRTLPASPPEKTSASSLAAGDPPGSWSPQQDGHGHEAAEQAAQPEVYRSVTETHLSPKSTDSSQLFYGPSSNFAFLQQIHRAILSASHHDYFERPQGQSGLDTFMQRSIFFGTPSRIDPEAIRSPHSNLQVVSKEQAREFLQEFKEGSLYRLPFFTESELESLFDSLYDARESQALPPQTKAIFLAMLAIGALSTSHTILAETLFTEAKREAVLFDDAVTLQMLQLSMLFADYQINMGRPNSTYLHLGVACRKAFALGLHVGALATRLDGDTLKKHSTTLWLLYFYETCQALTLGRRSALRLSDIAFPFPNEPSTITGLFRIAKIMEETAESIYRRKATHIRQLYVTAESLYTQLREFAEVHGIASAHSMDPRAPSQAVEAVTLHNLYYLAVVLVFRPFLVASHAMRTSNGAKDAKQMWLRQACRYAVDAAQDSIVYSSEMLTSGLCKLHRYQGFFMECSCAVLLYDILCQPSKYTYNMEYIQKALQCMEGLVADEPVTIAIKSIRKIVRVIEKSISNQANTDFATPSAHSQDSPYYPNIRFPPLGQLNMDGPEQMIFLTGGVAPTSGQTCHPDASVPGTAMDQDWLNPNHFNLNVMTTDLFNFFPLDISTPQDYPGGRTDGR